mmetsp:Transcript_10820/g.34278  ORF Transcript_10820/g.34278 Transcript_10820/m.34278 type:complete len:658 (-) Transcript_10820:424-2397(-)
MGGLTAGPRRSHHTHEHAHAHTSGALALLRVRVVLLHPTALRVVELPLEAGQHVAHVRGGAARRNRGRLPRTGAVAEVLVVVRAEEGGAVRVVDGRGARDNFRRACVEDAEVEGEALDLAQREGLVVAQHVVVRRARGALQRIRGDQVEIVLARLGHARVDDSAWLAVLPVLAPLALHRHAPLAEARLGAHLRDDEDEPWGVAALVVAGALGTRPLDCRNLLLRNLVEHVVRDAITVDDDALRRPAGRVLLDKRAEQLGHFALHPVDWLRLLLVLLLDDRVVLGDILVDRADDRSERRVARSGTGVVDVDANDHRRHRAARQLEPTAARDAVDAAELEVDLEHQTRMVLRVVRHGPAAAALALAAAAAAAAAPASTAAAASTASAASPAGGGGGGEGCERMRGAQSDFARSRTLCQSICRSSFQPVKAASSSKRALTDCSVARGTASLRCTSEMLHARSGASRPSPAAHDGVAKPTQRRAGRRGRRRAARRAATPAPSEWPASTTSQPQTSERWRRHGPSSRCSHRAVRAMPACAQPPQKRVACARESVTMSERSCVPRTTSTARRRVRHARKEKAGLWAPRACVAPCSSAKRSSYPCSLACRCMSTSVVSYATRKARGAHSPKSATSASVGTAQPACAASSNVGKAPRSSRRRAIR